MKLLLLIQWSLFVSILSIKPHVCGETITLRVDTDKHEFHPLTRSKFGVGATLRGLVEPSQTDAYHNTIAALTALRPALCNLTIELSSARLEESMYPDRTGWGGTEEEKAVRAEAEHYDSSYFVPSPAWRLSRKDQAFYEPSSPTAPADLTKLQADLAASFVQPFHQLMGAPQAWYNNDPDITEGVDAASMAQNDDRFPVPSRPYKNGEGMWVASDDSKYKAGTELAAYSTARWCAPQTTGHLPPIWGIWQEAGHYLRDSKYDVSATHYSGILANYGRTLKSYFDDHPSSLPPAYSASDALAHRRRTGMQLLTASDTVAVTDEGEEVGAAKSFIYRVLTKLENNAEILSTGEKLDRLIDSIHVNEYKTRLSSSELIDFDAVSQLGGFRREINSARQEATKLGDMDRWTFIYSQIATGKLNAEGGDSTDDYLDPENGYRSTMAAALDMLNLQTKAMKVPDLEALCWDGVTNDFFKANASAVTYSPSYRAMYCLNSMIDTAVDISPSSGVVKAAAGYNSPGKVGSIMAWTRNVDNDDQLKLEWGSPVFYRYYIFSEVDQGNGLTGTLLPAASLVRKATETTTGSGRFTSTSIDLSGKNGSFVYLLFASTNVGIEGLAPGDSFSYYRGAEHLTGTETTKAKFLRRYNFVHRDPVFNNKGSYAYLDTRSNRAYLGCMQGGRAIVGGMYDNLPASLRVYTDTNALASSTSVERVFGIRVDYFVGNQSSPSKSALWRIGNANTTNIDRTRKLPWPEVTDDSATADAVDSTFLSANAGNQTLNLSSHDPDGWSGKALISFWMEDVGVAIGAQGATSIIELRKPAP